MHSTKIDLIKTISGKLDVQNFRAGLARKEFFHHGHLIVANSERCSIGRFGELTNIEHILHQNFRL